MVRALGQGDFALPVRWEGSPCHLLSATQLIWGGTGVTNHSAGTVLVAFTQAPCQCSNCAVAQKAVQCLAP